MNQEWISWNNNIRHTFKNMHFPSREEEICRIVQSAETTVRVVGRGYSSADIAAGADTLISQENYDTCIHVDKENHQITVQAGMPLKELCQTLEYHHMTLPALPDIDAVTVGGALATGTHGTGKNARILSEYLISCRLITAEGDIRHIHRGSDLFDAVKVSLGLLGIFSTLTFQAVPLYSMNITEKPMKDREWMEKYEDMQKNRDFFRMLWLPHTNHAYTIGGTICTDSSEPLRETPPPFFHAYRRTLSKYLYSITTLIPPLTPLANSLIYALFFSYRQQKHGTLYEKTVTKTRTSPIELAEWIVDRKRFPALMKELRKKLHSPWNNSYAHIPMDIRFICADTSWLSPAFGTDSITMGCVTRKPARADSYKAFETVEKIFLKYNGRPHWAKHFSCTKEDFARLYPKWNDFIALRRKMDPRGKFLTPYLRSIFE
ncbi:MAG: D-arabinono-1,4-lactone oxidase [Fibrobacterota bacterium]